MVRRLVTAVLATALLGASGVAAASNGKQRVVVEQFVEEYAFVAVDCSTLGPYDFSVAVDGTVRLMVTDVFGDDGSLQQTVIHAVLNETDTNTVSGKTLPLHGAFHEVRDYASNTRTVTGGVFMSGAFIKDAGRIAMTLDTRVAEFVAGHHEVFFGGGIDAVICAALADDA